MFLNAVATRLSVTLTPKIHAWKAELATRIFAGARLQGFVPPVTSGPAFNIRKPASTIHTLDDCAAAGILTGDRATVLEDAVAQRRNVLVVGGTTYDAPMLAYEARNDKRRSKSP